MPKIARFHQTGGPEVLRLEELPLEQPKENEVRIKVQAIGLNRAEVGFRMGRYLETPNLPARLGYEAAGVVDAVGPGVTRFKPGDKVSTVPSFSQNQYGMVGEVVIAPVHAVARYPENLSPVEAAAIWMQYLTAWGGLMEFGKAEAGQAVLITAASSSVGLAAIELAKLAGAKAIASTRTSAKKQQLLDFGADAVIASEEEDLPEQVAKLTGGKGADLIFDPVAGSFLETLGKAAAHGGYIIEYGNLSLQPTPFPLFAAFSKALTIRGYTLFELNRRPELREMAEHFIYEQLALGKLKPKIDPHTFRLDQIVDAYRFMESNQQFGKIVVTV